MRNNCKFCKKIINISFKSYNYKNNKNSEKFYQCNNCEVLYQPKIIKNLYDDQDSSNYNLSKNIFFYLKQLIFVYFIFNIRKFFYQNKDILDYGCGSGEFAVALSNFFKNKNIFTTDVFDLDKKFIPKIKKHFLLHKEELLGKKFDVILLRHVFEHLYDLNSFLAKIKKNMKNSKSLLIIEVPNMHSFWRKVMGKKWPGYFYPYHYYVFSQKFLRNILIKNGFIIIEQKKLESPIIGSFLLTLKINHYICKLLSIMFYPFQFLISKLFLSSESILIIARKKSD